MSFRDYIKDKLIYIILILFGTITSEILLLASDITLYIRVYVGIIPILMLFICLGIEYYKKNRYYKNLKENMEELDEKYLISEIIKTPNFLEGGILKEILQDTGKSMI